MNFRLLLVLSIFYCSSCAPKQEPALDTRPNILFAISDDQSFGHTSFAGAKFVHTPAFDRVARSGVYFRNCLAGSPGCAPSRSSIVTGRYHWQNEQSGQHASGWLKKYVPFVDLLKANGYHTGLTQKGVGPFQYYQKDRIENDSFRVENAAGKAYNLFKYEEGTPSDERFASGIRNNDYSANFKAFLEKREAGQPFFFWYGASEPHRQYEKGAGLRRGKKLESVEVPAFFPDVDEIRSDILDYAVEIEWFDLHLERMINHLDAIGELENTIIIVTADNGMPFPRAKANAYEYGVHVPMAVSFPKNFPGGRIVDDLVSFVDLAPTILELSGTNPEGMLPISGKSIAHLLRSKEEGMIDKSKKYIFAGRERHSSSRYRNLGYPQRVIRSADYIYIWNQRPERWPAGAPQRIQPDTEGELWPLYGLDEDGKHHSEWAFTDVDACPTKSFLIENHQVDSLRPYFDLAYGKRPEYELFDIKKDAACLHNLAGVPAFQTVEEKLKQALMKELEKSGDPRVVGSDPEIFDSYLRYSPMREFPKPDWME